VPSMRQVHGAKLTRPHGSPSGDRDHLKGNLLVGRRQPPPDYNRQRRAAGHLHLHDRDAPDIGDPEDLRELCGILFPVVELGAAEHDHLPGKEVPVEARVGQRRAVGRDEQVRALEERGICRYEPDLDRPVAEGGRDLVRSAPLFPAGEER